MAEITAHLSEDELRALQVAAQHTGKSVEEIASEAVSAAIRMRYTLREMRSNVVTFQGLKSLDRRHNRE
ncbi:hypothetical protein EO087_00080 [Dyella sp. M7H15-1]|uniref:hypothetical protein n=1 Tax=Dyella sp. M7H15-1 TaxID=2501295 RepID=UPI001005142F|nr:hypothetical protein [Dyella sp. M7H15-1]QAU22567.1 hypothetical protein EO087_00080 [Dyella sp. M7H15-1]